ncbi:MAG: hypothetical protein ACOY3H_00170 [Bacillota bacterium]|uniref:hypothetical protein n=1 Tax=unclassified Carboxydocella TaxID=2685367 RepID=UPI0009AD0AD2|nr:MULTISPECIES: hypothetical protein [unclassified Carboxydocella]AVX31239.1 hypothetical protein CTH_1663 [Carboxydocella thermautotrophica]GAW30010.1 hypothetical protein ULO1_25800 [Carboxydocella sp. ULO1]GAW32083.1 hypothetical protein JDF658_18480 [Carboxydocella sp. JDF658]
MAEKIWHWLCEHDRIYAGDPVWIKPLQQLSREERRKVYGAQGRAVAELILKTLKEDTALAAEWEKAVIESVLAKGGDRDFLDSQVMAVLGPLKLNHYITREAEARGILLKTGASQGGCMLAIVIMTLVVAVIAWLTR